MTSENPSVFSGAACATSTLRCSFAAASAMKALPETAFFCARALLRSAQTSSSVEIVHVFGDVLGKAERVIAHQNLGAAGVARFQRLDNLGVVADRAIGAIPFPDRLSPDHAHVGEQILGKIDKRRVAAHANESLMKFDVDLRIFVEMRPHFAVLERREHAA